MAISYEGAGTVTIQTAANPSVGLPSGIQANDICLWQTLNRAAGNHTYPAAWTKVVQFGAGVNTLDQSWAWKRMAGGESGNETVTISGTSLKESRISLWRGARTSGNPYEATASTISVSPNSTVNPLAVSITDAADMIVGFMAIANDVVLDPMSGGSGVGTVTEAYEHPTITGADGNLVCDYAFATATGAVDLGFDIIATAEYWIAFTIALTPPAAGGPPKGSLILLGVGY